MSENPWKKWRDAVGPPPVNEQTPSRTGMRRGAGQHRFV